MKSKGKIAVVLACFLIALLGVVYGNTVGGSSSSLTNLTVDGYTKINVGQNDGNNLLNRAKRPLISEEDKTFYLNPDYDVNTDGINETHFAEFEHMAHLIPHFIAHEWTIRTVANEDGSGCPIDTTFSKPVHIPAFHSLNLDYESNTSREGAVWGLTFKRNVTNCETTGGWVAEVNNDGNTGEYYYPIKIPSMLIDTGSGTSAITVRDFELTDLELYSDENPSLSIYGTGFASILRIRFNADLQGYTHSDSTVQSAVRNENTALLVYGPTVYAADLTINGDYERALHAKNGANVMWGNHNDQDTIRGYADDYEVLSSWGSMVNIKNSNVTYGTARDEEGYGLTLDKEDRDIYFGGDSYKLMSTDTNTDPFRLSRTRFSEASEVLLAGVEDTIARFTFNQDESGSENIGIIWDINSTSTGDHYFEIQDQASQLFRLNDSGIFVDGGATFESEDGANKVKIQRYTADDQMAYFTVDDFDLHIYSVQDETGRGGVQVHTEVTGTNTAFEVLSGGDDGEYSSFRVLGNNDTIVEGRLGVKDSTPDYDLDVEGSVFAQDYYASNGVAGATTSCGSSTTLTVVNGLITACS